MGYTTPVNVSSANNQAGTFTREVNRVASVFSRIQINDSLNSTSDLHNYTANALVFNDSTSESNTTVCRASPIAMLNETGQSLQQEVTDNEMNAHHLCQIKQLQDELMNEQNRKSELEEQLLQNRKSVIEDRRFQEYNVSIECLYEIISSYDRNNQLSSSEITRPEDELLEDEAARRDQIQGADAKTNKEFTSLHSSYDNSRSFVGKFKQNFSEVNSERELIDRLRQLIKTRCDLLSKAEEAESLSISEKIRAAMSRSEMVHKKLSSRVQQHDNKMSRLSKHNAELKKILSELA